MINHPSSFIKKRSFLSKRKKEICLLLIILLVGLVVRFDDILSWRADPSSHLFHGEPVITTYDGYYYLSLAQDLVDGNYQEIDVKRIVPESSRRPSPPPLISVLAATIVNYTSFSLNWVAFFLPAFLGVLLAVPVYVFGRYFGGVWMGAVAAIIAVFPNYYISRSSIGWFDTDCLNVTFSLAISYCFLRFGLVRQAKRYSYFFVGLLFAAFYVWWWDQARYTAVLISLFPFLMALLFFYRPGAREGRRFYCVILLGVIVILAQWGFDVPFKLFSSLMGQLAYISKKTGVDFPGIGIAISEQSRMPLASFIKVSINHWLAFIVGVLGLLHLFYKHRREFLFLLVPVVLSLCAYFYANRFIIFFVPLISLGLAAVFRQLWDHSRNFKVVRGGLLALLLLLLSQSLLNEEVRSPSIPPYVVSGLAEIDRISEQDAVIWSWGDIGYGLLYWGRRGIINDGQSHSGERTVYNAIPYVSNNFRFAANFISFYVSRGMSGMQLFYDALGGDRDRGLKLIKQILASGPEDAANLLKGLSLTKNSSGKTVGEWLEFFYPGNGRPVYLFVDWHMSMISQWIYWYGTWDIAQQDGEKTLGKGIISGKLVQGNVLSQEGFQASLEDGTMELDNKKAFLRSAAVTENGATYLINFPYNEMQKSIGVYSDEQIKLTQRLAANQGQYHLEINNSAGYVAFQDVRIAETIMNKLFWRNLTPPAQYFRAVLLRTPYYQVWQVSGDKIEGIGQ